ncbi:MAG: prephenate dehydrogenase/arogenate dehydrogenase family protein [Chthoniobacteraceae bacterium]
MTRIAILGPGLIGGSIALALRRAKGSHVTLWARRAEAVSEANAANCADAVTGDLSAAVKDADLVVLCVPVGAMAALAAKIAPVISRGCIITDVGSVKGPVLAELRPIFRECGRLVGSHPMAGSEYTGLAAARANLFDGTTCIVTPDADTDAAALAEVAAFWQRLGCRVVELPAAEHDECVALVSHLPHLLAATLVNTVGARNGHAFRVVGPGFRDTTRVAGGPPAMWREILRENAAAVLPAIDALIAKLAEFRHTLALPGDGRETHEFLAAARAARDRITFPK